MPNERTRIGSDRPRGADKGDCGRKPGPVAPRLGMNGAAGRSTASAAPG